MKDKYSIKLGAVGAVTLHMLALHDKSPECRYYAVSNFIAYPPGYPYTNNAVSWMVVYRGTDNFAVREMFSTFEELLEYLLIANVVNG
jgi:hypothetical protein